MNNQSDAYAAFTDELLTVQNNLFVAAEELGSPLGELVRAQVKRALPPMRGAFILAVAVNATATLAADELRRRRILLASALEMLHVAQNVHRLLVVAAGGAGYSGTTENADHGSHDEPLERSFIGSTILAGDYCFSRAAQMAAHTDNPQVVTIFAQALQNISEGQLRHQFHQEGRLAADAEMTQEQYDETGELLRSGAMAAVALADLSARETELLMLLSQEFATYLATGKLEIGVHETPSSAELQPSQQARWQMLRQWLATQPANGYPATPASTPNHYN